MFTGIIETIGKIESISGGTDGVRIEIFMPGGGAALELGESVSVDGACLTVEESQVGRFVASVSPESLERTTFSRRLTGDSVNLERALRAGSRMGGHMVSGHVDARGRIRSITPRGNSWDLAVEAPESVLRLCVEKGSVAVDGVSLTIAQMDADGFSCAIIPQTWKFTTLSLRRPGDEVNLESDLIAKYVARLTRGFGPGAGEVTWDTLDKAGFLE